MCYGSVLSINNTYYIIVYTYTCMYVCTMVCMYYYTSTLSHSHIKGKVFVLLANSSVAVFRRFPGTACIYIYIYSIHIYIVHPCIYIWYIYTYVCTHSPFTNV